MRNPRPFTVFLQNRFMCVVYAYSVEQVRRLIEALVIRDGSEQR